MRSRNSVKTSQSSFDSRKQLAWCCKGLAETATAKAEAASLEVKIWKYFASRSQVWRRAETALRWAEKPPPSWSQCQTAPEPAIVLWCFWKLFFCMWMSFVISFFAQTLVNPVWLEPCSQHPMACATKFPALRDDMKYGTVSSISISRQATWIEAICHCKRSNAAVVFDSYWHKLQTRNKNKPAIISNTSSAASTRKKIRANGKGKNAKTCTNMYEFWKGKGKGNKQHVPDMS